MAHVQLRTYTSTHIFTCILCLEHGACRSKRGMLHTFIHVSTRKYKCIHVYLQVYHLVTYRSDSIHVYTRDYTCILSFLQVYPMHTYGSDSIHVCTRGYTCIHVYLQVHHMQTCRYDSIHVCTRAYTCIFASVPHADMWIWPYSCVHLNIRVYMYICKCTTCTHADTTLFRARCMTQRKRPPRHIRMSICGTLANIHVYTYIHVYTHECIQIFRARCMTLQELVPKKVYACFTVLVRTCWSKQVKSVLQKTPIKEPNKRAL